MNSKIRTQTILTIVELLSIRGKWGTNRIRFGFADHCARLSNYIYLNYIYLQ